MQQTKPENRVWRTLGPIVVYYVISLLAGSIMGAVLLQLEEMRANKSIMDVGSNSEMIERLSPILIKYALHISIATMVVIIPIMLWKFHKDRLREVTLNIEQPKKAPLFKYIGIILLGVFLCIGLNNLVTLSNLAMASDAYQEVSQALYTPGILLQILGAGIIIPIGEELVFRGLVYKRFRERNSMWKAAFFASFAFGIIHGNMVQFIYALVMGMALCYVYEQYGSIKAPVALHITANLISVIATKFEWFEWIFHSPMRAGVITVLCASASSALYVWMQRIDNGQKN